MNSESHSELDVVDQLADVLGWHSKDITHISKLGGGPTSDSYCFCYRLDRYVIRVDKPLAQTFGLNRQDEQGVYKVVADLGLAPSMVFSKPEKGVLVRPFIEGCVWQASDLGLSNNLVRLASALRALHHAWSEPIASKSIEPKLQNFDLSGAVDHYARILASNETAKLSHTAKGLIEFIQPSVSSLCHNDLVVQNIVDDGSIKLIDWEFAALGDPAFDLAIVIQHHQMPAHQRQVFLNAYYPTLDRDQDSRVACFQKIYAHLLVLWLSVVQLYERSSQADNDLFAAKTALIQAQSMPINY